MFKGQDRRMNIILLTLLPVISISICIIYLDTIKQLKYTIVLVVIYSILLFTGDGNFISTLVKFGLIHIFYLFDNKYSKFKNRLMDINTGLFCLILTMLILNGLTGILENILLILLGMETLFVASRLFKNRDISIFILCMSFFIFQICHFSNFNSRSIILFNIFMILLSVVQLIIKREKIFLKTTKNL